MDPFLQKILENTFTLSRLKHRLHALREYVSHQIFAKGETSGIETADLKWLNSLGNPFFLNFSRDNFDGIFKNLEDYLKNCRPLIIYLAFEPTEELLQTIGLYLRKNFTKYPIFDAKVDPELIAGAALSFNGVYKDYSLRVKINNEKEKILANFKKFLT